MKLFRNISIVSLVCIALGFMFFSSPFPKHKSPVYVEYADKITGPFLQHLKKMYNMKCYGKGGGFLSNVERIRLALESEEENVSISRARELHINFTEELKNRINKDEKIRPYLDHYPFSERGACLSISFKGSIEQEKKYVSYVCISSGVIHYAYRDSESRRLFDLYEEPYEEALRIVKEEGKLEFSR